MPTVATILDLLYAWAPRDLAWAKDNIGLLVGAAANPVSRILVCLDVTPETVAEAVAVQADLIVAHHPIIFHPLRSVRTDDRQGRMITDLMRGGISVIAMHTNADAASQGLNRAIAGRLGLSGVRPLENGCTPRSTDGTASDTGLGAVGILPAPMAADDFLAHVRTALACENLRFSHGPAGRMVRTVALCGGSGGGLIGDAIACGADAFVTADLVYHAFQDHRDDLLLIDAGHYETELVFVDLCAGILAEGLFESKEKIDILRTVASVNPVRFMSFSKEYP